MANQKISDFFILDQTKRDKILSIFCYEVKILLGVYVEKHNSKDNFTKEVQIATSESMLIHTRNQ